MLSVQQRPQFTPHCRRCIHRYLHGTRQLVPQRPLTIFQYVLNHFLCFHHFLLSIPRVPQGIPNTPQALLNTQLFHHSIPQPLQTIH